MQKRIKQISLTNSQKCEYKKLHQQLFKKNYEIVRDAHARDFND